MAKKKPKKKLGGLLGRVVRQQKRQGIDFDKQLRQIDKKGKKRRT